MKIYSSKIGLQILTGLLLVTSFLPEIAAQQIIKVVMVGNEGITEDAGKAHSFIVIKSLDDNRLERLDYKKGGPVQKIRTYKDSLLQVLDGRHLEYYPSGHIHYFGNYSMNKKSGHWRTYNDTGKVVLIEEYEDGYLLKSENPNTVRKVKQESYPDERAAQMRGGQKLWLKYLVKRLEETKATDNSFNGGTVRVAFAIDTTGKVFDTYLMKSAEFILDEEAIDVIKKSPLWEPAFENGHPLNAYRVQPLTFVK